MSLKEINASCEAKIQEIKTSQTAEKIKELPPLVDENSERPFAGRFSQDYYSAFSEICQADDLLQSLETWIKGFIEDVYNCQSEDWQHGFDTGEKITELRHLIGKARGETV